VTHLESKGHDDPSRLHINRITHERIVGERLNDSDDVVFHVLLVIREIRIAPALTGREQNIESCSSGAEAEPRSDRPILLLLDQRTLELANEPVREMFHDDQPGISATDIVVDDPPSEQGHDHRAAKPQPREVDPGDWTDGLGEPFQGDAESRD
jgi:hypothetical protein